MGWVPGQGPCFVTTSPYIILGKSPHWSPDSPSAPSWPWLKRSSSGTGLSLPTCVQLADHSVVMTLDSRGSSSPCLSQPPLPALGPAEVTEIDCANKAIPLIREGREGVIQDQLSFSHHKHLNITLPGPQRPQAIPLERFYWSH